MNEQLLLGIAKRAIDSYFDGKVILNKERLLEEHADLKQLQACFVTLTLHGKLRGCIGSLMAHRSLLEDLVHNAKAAAFHDPRFPPLQKEEWTETKVEISLLTQPKLLAYSSFEELEKKLIPYQHGVILELDGKRATFLPQVWEQLPTFNEFMVHLCKKAGLNPSQLRTLPQIQIYEAIKIKE